jgi:hypothetical protein
MTDRPNGSDDEAKPDTGTCFTRSGSAWSEVTLLSDDNYRIRVGGMLHSAWMVGVCNGLARASISIDRAHARRLAHDGTWIAELHVVALPGAPDPLQLPLIRFAEDASTQVDEALCLREYELGASSDHGGTLRLNFNAQDSVGLLGSLLAALAGLSLLPVEMHIETRAAEAHDCLWLTATGEATPSEADLHALDRLLRGAIQH